MKKLHLILALVMGLGLMSDAYSAAVTTGKAGLPQPAALEQKLNTSATAGPAVGLGSQITTKKIQVMKAVYDFAKLGGASGATLTLKDASGGDAIIPKGAIIIGGLTDEITNVTVSGASISLGIETAVDLLAATAGATFSGRQAIIPVGTAATAVKVTSTNAAVTATITGGTVTAGKINVFLEYLISE